MGPPWGLQGPGGPHIGRMNLAIWDDNAHINYPPSSNTQSYLKNTEIKILFHVSSLYQYFVYQIKVFVQYVKSRYTQLFQKSMPKGHTLKWEFWCTRIKSWWNQYRTISSRRPLIVVIVVPETNSTRMMTLWHGSAFHITGPLHGESLDHQWIPFARTKQVIQRIPLG